MIVQVELTRSTVLSIALIVFLAVLGAIYIFKLATRKRCACALCVGDFEIKQELGYGGFGRVYSVVENVSGREFVLKKVLVEDVNSAAVAQSEAKQLIMLHHRLVVGYELDFLHVEELVATRVVVDPRLYVCIVMENCSNGDLKSFMEKQRDGHFDDDNEPSYLEAETICRWMHQIAIALSYCHAHGVVHRDIKAHNIFLSADLEIRLGDFGLSRRLWSTEGFPDNSVDNNLVETSSQSPCPSPCKQPELRQRRGKLYPDSASGKVIQSFTTAGTDVYKPPELFSGGRGGFGHDYKAVDMWGCGLLFVELLTLEFTWERQGLVGARALNEGLEFLFDEIPKHYLNRRVLDTIRMLLTVRPEERLTAVELKMQLEKAFPKLSDIGYT